PRGGIPDLPGRVDRPPPLRRRRSVAGTSTEGLGLGVAMRAVLRRVGAALFIGDAFYFLGRALVDQREQLAAFDWSVEPIGLAASLVALVAVLAGGVAIWASVLRHLGHRVRFLDLLRIWFLSSLGRYIPGKIWQFVGVAEMSRASGIPALVGITSLM